MSVILPTPGPAGVGEDNSTACPKINAALLGLDSRADYTAGSARRALVTGIGDSIIGYLLGNQDAGIGLSNASPFGEIVASHYNADIEINNRGGEYNFGAAGRTSQYILDNMVPAMRAYLAAGNRVPDNTIVSAGQNDGVLSLSGAQGTLANIKAIATAVRDMGVQNVIVMGMIPDPKIVGDTRPYALGWLNAELMHWATQTPGMIPFEVLSLVKDVSGAAEAQGANFSRAAVWWKPGVDGAGNVIPKTGSKEQEGLGGIGGTGFDNEHPAMLFARLVAPRLAAILRRLVPEYQMPDLVARDWDQNKDPNGNYLGLRGLNFGTGGSVNGATSSSVAAGWAMAYDTTAASGMTITPYIRKDANGFFRQGFTVSGTPTGSGVITFRMSQSAGAPSARYHLGGMLERIGVRGMAGYTLNGAGMDIGTAGLLPHIVPGSVSDVRRVRTLRPNVFANDFSGKDFTWSFGFVAGVPVEGSHEYWNTYLVRDA